MNWIVVKAVPGRKVPVEGAGGRYFAEGVAVRVADTRFIRIALAAGDLEETAEPVTEIVAEDAAHKETR